MGRLYDLRDVQRPEELHELLRLYQGLPPKNRWTLGAAKRRIERGSRP